MSTECAGGGGGGGRCASMTSTLISGKQSTCCASVTGCSDLRGEGEIESRRKVDVMNLSTHTSAKQPRVMVYSNALP